MARSVKESLEKAKAALKDLKAAKKGLRKITVKNCKSQSFVLSDVLAKHGKVVGKTVSALVTRFYKAVVRGDISKAVDYKKIFNAKLTARLEKAEKKYAKLKAEWKAAKAAKAKKEAAKKAKKQASKKKKPAQKGGKKKSSKKGVKKAKKPAAQKSASRKPSKSRAAKKPARGGSYNYMKSLFSSGGDANRAEFAELVL